jgi:predicted Zn finger-like uncharacterized protein
MALATRCPECATVFRISTAQAAAKSGMVRCGACRNVFNSLDALVRVEDLDVVEEVTIEPMVTEEAPTGDTLFAIDGPLADSELHGFSATEMPLGTPTEFEGLVPVDAERVEPSFASERRAVISEWWLPDAAPGRLPPTKTTNPPETDWSAPPLGREAATAGGRAEPSTSGRDLRAMTARPALEPIDEAPLPPAGTNPLFMRPKVAPEATPRVLRWTLALLSIVALAALLAQGAYLWRAELAARWSPARAPLEAACAMLRCTVGYPIHPESITIESAAVTTTGPGANSYQLTALLRNREGIDLQYPTLDLVLTDTDDRPVLRRALQPRDYLSGRPPRQATQGFPAQSELPIRIDFELTNLRFAGYRLLQVYP